MQQADVNYGATATNDGGRPSGTKSTENSTYDPQPNEVTETSGAQATTSQKQKGKRNVLGTSTTSPYLRKILRSRTVSTMPHWSHRCVVEEWNVPSLPRSDCACAHALCYFITPTMCKGADSTLTGWTRQADDGGLVQCANSPTRSSTWHLVIICSLIMTQFYLSVRCFFSWRSILKSIWTIRKKQNVNIQSIYFCNPSTTQTSPCDVT